MLCTEFMELWYTDTSLREEVLRLAKKRSRYNFIREEYVQEAWLVISTAPAGKTTEYYAELARRAIYSAYWQNHKQQLLTRQRPPGGYHKPEDYDEYIEEHDGSAAVG